MATSAEFRSGKGSRDENFPVASWLIKPQHRPAILAFYEFVRVADDIADHASLTSGEKIERLNGMEASLLGKSDHEPEGVRLRGVLEGQGLTSRHAQDLLDAFRQDATKRRYANWDELIDYCSRSAMPVGRFVLDVHGESKATWPANDALCAALQIINHLQDCGSDYQRLNRIYLPLDAMAAAGVSVDMLARNRASPALRECLKGLVAQTSSLLRESQGFAASVKDRRLGLEIAVIQTLARRLLRILARRDPLSEPVHLSKTQAAGYAVRGAVGAGLHRLLRAVVPAHRYQVS
ncbi:MAG TPA: squalene synthase HpnC [Pseudolabrys sp.]|jgi:squalene synthase HpnC